MVTFQPELPLKAMQWQGSVLMFMAYISTGEHKDVPGWGSFWGLPGCPGAMQKWSHPHRMKCSGELGPSLTTDSTQESGPHTSFRQHSRAGPNGWGGGELTPPFVCPLLGSGAGCREGNVPPTHTCPLLSEVAGNLDPEGMRTGQHRGASPEGKGMSESACWCESKRAGSALHRLQHLGERASSLDWAAQCSWLWTWRYR